MAKCKVRSSDERHKRAVRSHDAADGRLSRHADALTLAAILNAYPNVRGTLFDRPDVAANARAQLAAAGLTERVTVTGGDFFEGVPGGGDVYVLSRVLHDWDDERAVRILKSCRGAMRERGRIVIADAIIGERVHDQPAAVRMDLHMLTLTSGRERTAAEFATVLRAAGLQLARILTPSGTACHPDRRSHIQTLVLTAGASP